MDAVAFRWYPLADDKLPTSTRPMRLPPRSCGGAAIHVEESGLASVSDDRPRPARRTTMRSACGEQV